MRSSPLFFLTRTTGEDHGLDDSLVMPILNSAAEVPQACGEGCAWLSPSLGSHLVGQYDA